MANPILEISNMYAGYDGAPVVFDISLEVMPGELVAMVGANGAGKSTIMRSIAGLNNPLRGGICFHGHDISRMPAHRTVALGISYVPEGRRVFSKLSVEKNLLLGAYTEKSAPEIRQRLDEVLELFPVLRSRSGQTAETLSGGEQQMLAIARGLMSRPRLLILDEMSLGLMPMLVEKMLETVSAINRSGVTILLVEQMVQEALEIAHRGYVLQSGRIIQHGSARELMDSEAVRKAYLGM